MSGRRTRSRPIVTSVTPDELPLPIQTTAPRLIQYRRRILTERTATPIAIALSMLAGVGDAVTTAEAPFTLFYIAPIALTGWFCGLRVALVIAGLCAAITTCVSVFVDPPASSLLVTVWNKLTELGLFAASAYVIAQLRQRRDLDTSCSEEVLDHMRHAERLITVGKLASGLAHELGTPLNVVSGRASLIAEGRVDSEGAKRSANIIIAQTEQMEALVRHLLTFAHRGSTEGIPHDILALCQETAELLLPLAKQKSVAIAVRGESAIARVSHNEIQQVLSNIIANALQAMGEGGTITVATEVTRAAFSELGDEDERSYVVVRVSDQGTGIAPEIMPFIFDPFFTTKDVRQGTGLGLSIAFGIVRDHRGAIRVESALGQGTTFSVYLPRQ